MPSTAATATSKKQAPSKKQKRESALLAELCKEHGYTFADTLPGRDRITMLMTKGSDGKTSIDPYPVVKLMIPGDSALGQQILARRKTTPGKGKR